MALENKLGLTSSADLAREEERISKKKAAELFEKGILDKYHVQVIGVQVDAIERGEDRIEFKRSMDAIGIEMARSEVAYTVDEALSIADKLGYPVVLRPAYTMGGAGGGLSYIIAWRRIDPARDRRAAAFGGEGPQLWRVRALRKLRPERCNLARRLAAPPPSFRLRPPLFFPLQRFVF